jgi:hypothetical protein
MAQRVAQYLFDWQVISILEFLAEIYAMVLAQWQLFLSAGNFNVSDG